MQSKDLGADGVVLGMLTKDGDVDTARTREFVELASPLQVTFHRAFDMSADLDTSLARVIETGAHRILTSGGMQSVAEGADRVKRLIEISNGKIRIMVGGGIRRENIHEIALRTGATEFHSSLRTRTDSPMTFRNDALKLGSAGDEFARFVVLEKSVRSLRDALDDIAHGTVGEFAELKVLYPVEEIAVVSAPVSSR